MCPPVRTLYVFLAMYFINEHKKTFFHIDFF